jgi:hypothetical protein
MKVDPGRSSISLPLDVEKFDQAGRRSARGCFRVTDVVFRLEKH